MKAINWKDVNDLDMLFWNQNVRQFWVDSEIPLSNDKGDWKKLGDSQRDAFKKVLAGLTLLDTFQATIGIPKIAEHVKSPHSKSILGVMAMMEHMHAKSYSSIFTTVCTSDEIEKLFNWVDNEKRIESKLSIIQSYYDKIKDDETLCVAMICSVFLETFLFYSGFYYPLLLAGKGKMVCAGEIINLIIRDESVHGVYVGLLVKNLMKTFTPSVQSRILQDAQDIFGFLNESEKEYTRLVYGGLGITEDVDTFVQYNANKAFANCGLELPYPNFLERSVNPVVFQGLDTSTKLHDFFSVKGNGYVKAMKVEELEDSDFY